MISTAFKQKVVAAIKDRRKNYASDAATSNYLGINKSIYSRLVNKGEHGNLLDDASWISIARILDVQLNDRFTWVTVETETYTYITGQLRACKDLGLSRALCDVAGIGKSHTAKIFRDNNPNTAFIDCSICKTKQQLIRSIAKAFGLNSKQRYADVFSDLSYYLQGSEKPLIILDEVGDLKYEAFLELKGQWNLTAGYCGWYMMGADGLAKKIQDSLNSKKIGYAELFDRYGVELKRITRYPGDEGRVFTEPEILEFKKNQVAQVAQANQVQNLQQIVAKTKGSLRLLYDEVKKQRLLN